MNLHLKNSELKTGVRRYTLVVKKCRSFRFCGTAILAVFFAAVTGRL
jgi:hypothetical protein